MKRKPRNVPKDSLASVIREHLMYKRIRFKPKTAEHAEGTLKLFLQWCTENGITTAQQIDRQVIRRYVLYVMETVPNRDTQWSFCCDLRTFLNWMVREEILPAPPYRPGDFPPKPKPRPKPLTVDEVRRLLAACEDAGHKWIGARNRALIYTLLHTGMRRGELVQMTVGDVDRQTFTVTQKFDRPHVVHLNADCIAEIRRYLRLYARETGRELQPDEPLWWTYFQRPMDGYGVQIALLRLREKAGVHVHAHRLRATSATLRLALGASTELVRTALGHTDDRSLLAYVKLSQTDTAKLLDSTSPTRLLREKKRR